MRAARTAVVRRVGDLQHGRAGPGPLAAARHHAELEREQLVEGEAPQRRVAALEARRVVGLLEGADDADEVLLAPDRRPAGTPG